ncbi:tetratricopeptide repeat protein [Pseudofulvibacter geojedonensis]|uniref:Tetratricopeptide repeat protein n=1 Tax=Pseudofulvibacter geojedonensis TaxID=1123758 RepID=A0ABW3I541_9FLAO
MINKVTLIFILCSITYSCKSNKEDKVPVQHNPSRHINQEILNTNAYSYYLKGRYFLEANDFDSATFYLKKSLKYEKNPITYNELGRVELSKNNNLDAINYFKQSREVDPTYWINYINESRVFLILKKHSEAENILNKLIERSDSDYWISYANYYLALINYEQGNNCKKIQQLIEKSKNMELDPEVSKQYLKHKNIILQDCI